MTQADTPAPADLVEIVDRIESSTELDQAADALEAAARAVVRPGAVEDALLGRWLGHAVHPLMTDLPIGFWTSVTVLDLVGGRTARPAARRLLALGNLLALPTVATGLAEWLQADQRSRRVGVVHAGANSVGLALYVMSARARRRRHHWRGTVLALAGMGAATAGGYLGGHLVLARKVGSHDPRFAPAPQAG